MRKVLISVLALLTLLCACGAQEPDPYTLDDAQSLLDAGVFNGEMAPVDSYVVALLYGIDEETIQDCVSYQATNTSVSADELTVLILTSQEAAQAAEAACQDRVDSQISVCEDYCPAAVPRLESAVIRRAGSTVLLAVGDPDTLAEAVDGLHDL